MISFVIPAHNEELLIGRTLQSIHASARGVGRPYQIIVADDASTDSTAEIARHQGARVVSIRSRQIAAARNAGARAAMENRVSDVLVFLDADTLLPEATLRAALDAIATGAVGGGAAVQFDGKVPRWASVMLSMFLFVFRLMSWTGGCFVFCRRDAFEATGGWNAAVFAGEELWMCQALKRLGRFVILREAVITSGRKVRDHSAREILTNLARVAFRGPGGVRNRQGLEMWYGPRVAEKQT
jgi:glycosyltransferase involved in cell wall biosynthesis